ncbi:MAG: hypothetical protein ACI8Q1_002438 [Parvicella sp.]|jgi:hypothetical protein
MKDNDNTKIFFEGKPYEVPPGGSLGLLALGAVGVRVWREANKGMKTTTKPTSNEKK